MDNKELEKLEFSKLVGKEAFGILMEYRNINVECVRLENQLKKEVAAAKVDKDNLNERLLFCDEITAKLDGHAQSRKDLLAKLTEVKNNLING